MRTARAVVGDVQYPSRTGARAVDVDPGGVGVPGDIGEAFGDQYVGHMLDRGWQAVVVEIDVDIERQVCGEVGQGRFQSAFGQYPWGETAQDGTEFAQGFVDLPVGLGGEAAGGAVRVLRFGQSQVHRQCDEAVLDAVVQ